MIKIENLSFSYDNNQLFSNDSCIIPSKGLFVIKGNNGIGKSSLLKLIGGILKPSNGSINIDGITITSSSKESVLLSIRRRVAYISQKNELITFLNAKENSNLGNIIKNAPLVDLSLLNDSIYSSKKINTLSNGEKLLISIQRALYEEKHIFLLDECTDFLDSKNTNKIIDILKRLSKDNLILIVTHDERFISHFSNYIEIKNKNIECNFSINKTFNSDKTNAKNIKYHFSYLLKKLSLFHSLFILFLSIIVTVFSMILSSFFSFATYDFSKAYESTIGEGMYTLNNKIDNNLPITLDNIRYEYSKSCMSKDKFDIIESSYTPYAYDSNFGYIINNDLESGAVIITDNLYKEYLERGLIENENIILNYGNDMAKISIPYEIKYKNKDGNYDDDNLNLFSYYFNKKDIKKIQFNNGIKLYGSMWNNPLYDYTTKEGLENLFSSSGDITFLTIDIFNKINDNNFELDISDNEIYISSSNLENYVENNLQFFPFSQYEIGNYFPCFVDLNKSLSNSHLVKNSYICNYLKVNQVIVSDKIYKEIISLLPLYNYPIIKVTTSNISNTISFYKNNNFKLTPFSQINSQYSMKDYNTFKDQYDSTIGYYYYYSALIIIIELGLLYIFSYSYSYINADNFKSINIYFTKFKTTFIFSYPFLLTFIISTIVGIITSFFFSIGIYNYININILRLPINIYSAFLLIIINLFFYAFIFLNIYRHNNRYS